MVAAGGRMTVSCDGWLSDMRPARRHMVVRRGRMPARGGGECRHFERGPRALLFRVEHELEERIIAIKILEALPHTAQSQAEAATRVPADAVLDYHLQSCDIDLHIDAQPAA